MSDWHPAARELAEQGLGVVAIANRLGRSHGAVSKALHPERQRLYLSRRDPAEHRAANKAYEERHRHPCADCGALCGRVHIRCADCHATWAKAQTAERSGQIEAWWSEGLTLREIAARLGWSKNHLAVEIYRLRKYGTYHLPYRYAVGEDGRRQAA